MSRIERAVHHIGTDSWRWCSLWATNIRLMHPRDSWECFLFCFLVFATLSVCSAGLEDSVRIFFNWAAFADATQKEMLKTWLCPIIVTDKQPP